MLSLHDIPGTHKTQVVIPKLADKTEGEWVVFEAPFTCKVDSVKLRAGETWAGVNSGTNYEQFVLNNRGVDGTVSAAALGTVVGSINGNVVVQGNDVALYEPATPSTFQTNTVFTVKLGTVGAGSTAPPGMTAIVSFKGA